MFMPRCDHQELGASFFEPVKPAPFPKTLVRYRNAAWARRLGLGDLVADDGEWIKRFAKFEPFKDSIKSPLALAYHGHQFGVYNPDIGDGRGFLYAQMEDPVDNRLLDFGTKGSGLTPFSRTADGRLTLKGAVREILATEMLDALGVNTSKTFSVIETGESLERGDEPSPTRSAVLVRLSHGHIRIGSFQRLAYMGDSKAIEQLLRYSASRYFDDKLNEPSDFVAAVAENLATLTASWMAAGFVHGVLNTDNYNITGESFDYGPWRFLPHLDPSFTAAYFDHQGRYAYGNQPHAAFWALSRLAECFMDLAEPESLQKSVAVFQDRINEAIIKALCLRLGVAWQWEHAEAVSESLLKALRESGEAIGFEEVFFDWFGGSLAQKRAMDSERAKLYKDNNFKPLVDLLREAPPQEGLNLNHPYFARKKPVTMLIDEVESIWGEIANNDDWQALADALSEISSMAEAYNLTSQLPDSVVN